MNEMFLIVMAMCCVAAGAVVGQWYAAQRVAKSIDRLNSAAYMMQQELLDCIRGSVDFSASKPPAKKPVKRTSKRRAKPAAKRVSKKPLKAKPNGHDIEAIQ